MKYFEPDVYRANVRFRKKEVNVFTFFVSDGFDLSPFPKNKRPWHKSESKNNDGFDLYYTTAIIDFILPNGRVVRIPRGFQWDGASIPKWAQFIIGKPMGKYALAALLHDWLYQSLILGKSKKGRLEADELFYTVMEQLDISWWRRKAMYRAVRIGGKKPYFKNKNLWYCKTIFAQETKYNPWKDYKKFFPNS
tara:strand:+ start:1212 stop:1790 length:579 start_codon:yes stop_codon:yes gene_type:complete